MSRPSFPIYPIDGALVKASLAQVICHEDEQEICAADVVAILRKAGIRVYAAGGAPRDWLCGEVAKEIDLTVDAELTVVHELLRAAYPKIDPILGRLDHFGVLRWGEFSCGQIDINIIRSYRDIKNNDMWTTQFFLRQDLVEDALVRDFSFNAFYYDFENRYIIDPLHCGLTDLQQRTLRLIAHPLVLSGSFRTALRVVQFICRGYRLEPATHVFLERQIDRDILGMGYGRLFTWIATRWAEQKLEIVSFRDRLLEWVQADAARRLIEDVTADLIKDPPF